MEVVVRFYAHHKSARLENLVGSSRTLAFNMKDEVAIADVVQHIANIFPHKTAVIKLRDETHIIPYYNR